MKGWLIYQNQDAKENKFFISELISAFEALGQKLELVNYDNFALKIQRNHRPCDFVLNRSFNPDLTRIFEQLGIPVFNSLKVAEVGYDKALSMATATAIGIDVLPSVLTFGEEPLATEFDREVQKPNFGHGGQGVRLVDASGFDGVTGEKSATLHQLYSASEAEDHRCYLFLDGSSYWTVRTAAKGEFRANLKQGGKVEAYQPSEAEVEVASRLQLHLGPGNYAIDLIPYGDSYVLNEVEDVCGYRSLYQLALCDPAAKIAMGVCALI
ncbi:MAG: hypothetical protein HKL81_10405 [Acidimicrobiaceae bacterium]|nr:hypothetical protein [Acidimicrobiaceae bacterium]